MVDQRVTRNSSVTVISAADASLTRNISRQNKDRNLSQSQKKDTPEVVQNELLCFMQNKMDIFTQNMLVKSIVNFYTDSEIKEAKDMLFDKYGNKVSPSLKNCQRTGNGKSEKNVLDIYALLGRISLDICPVYVAANLAKLPPLDPDNYDAMALSQQVNEVRKGMSEFNNIASLFSEVNDIKMQLNDLLAIKHQVSEIAHQLTMPAQKNQTNKHSDACIYLPPYKLDVLKIVEYKFSCEMEAHVEVTTSLMLDSNTFKDKRHLLTLVAITLPSKELQFCNFYYAVDQPKVGKDVFRRNCLSVTLLEIKDIYLF